MTRFARRATRDETATELRRIWLSDCGRWRIVEATKKYRRGRRGRLREYRLEACDVYGWQPLSRHKRYELAAAAAETSKTSRVSLIVSGV